MNPHLHVVGEALPEAWLTAPDLVAAYEALSPKPALAGLTEKKRIVDRGLAILQRARRTLGSDSSASETRKKLLLPFLVHVLGVGRHEIRRDFRVPDPDGGEPIRADLVAVRDDRAPDAPPAEAPTAKKRTKRIGGPEDEVADDSLADDQRSDDEVVSGARARPYLIAYLGAHDDDLDARRAGLRGGRMIQQAAERLLTLSDATVAIVANGRELRVVRPGSSADSRYLAFDLERIGAGGDDAREALEILILLAGRDRLLDASDHEADLKRLLAAGDTYGTDIGRKLGQQARNGLEALVTSALRRSPDLAARAAADPVFVKTLFREGLYTLYRLFFVLYSEARGLLDLGNPAYRSGYGLDDWVRELANDDAVERQPNDPDGVRRHQLRALFDLLRDGSDHPELSVTPYGGKLFAPAQTEHLFGVEGRADLPGVPFSDRDLAEVVYSLTHADVKAGKGKKPRKVRVSYRDLGVEQLGGVYEGLLEYEPAVAREAMVFAKLARGDTKLGEAIVPKTSDLVASVEQEIPAGAFYLQVRGGARKGSGSYYTPKVLTDFLVKAGLKTKVDEVLADLRGLAEKRRAGIKAARDALLVQAPQRELFGTPAELPPGTPTIDELEASRDRLLGIRACDPAMGSGAFLVAVVKCLADAYEEAFRICEGCDVKLFGREAWPDDPRERERMKILIRRRVANHCVYGVDKNELAVELAKVSLWLLTLSRDRPLTFLDHRLRHGDSLMGAPLLRSDDYPVKKEKEEPRVLSGPAISFVRTECYDTDGSETSEAHRKAAARAKAENQQILFEQAGQEDQLGLFEPRRLDVAPLLAKYIETRAHVSGDEPESWPTLRVVEELGRREEDLRRALARPEWVALRDVCDLWCATFLWPDEGAANPPPTTRDYQAAVRWRLANEMPHVSIGEARVRQLFETAANVRKEHPFFHWELEYPELFFKTAVEGKRAEPLAEAARGFELMVGNPPWDTVHAKPSEYWRSIHPDTAAMTANEVRDWARPVRERDAALDRAYRAWSRDFDLRNAFTRGSGCYRRQGGGDPNTYKLFLERFDALIAERGVCAMLVPGGIYSDTETVELRELLVSERAVRALVGVENRALPRVFPDIKHQTKFTFLVYRKEDPSTPGVRCRFFVGKDETGAERSLNELGVAAWAKQFLRDDPNAVAFLPRDAIRVLSPFNGALVELPTVEDFWFAIHLGSVAPRFGDTTTDPWPLKASRELHSGGDRKKGRFKSDAWLRENGFVRDGPIAWVNKKTGLQALPLFGAGAFDQFDAFAGSILSWVVEDEGQEALGVVEPGSDPKPRAVAWKRPRVLFRDQARGTDARTLIATLVPRSFSEHTASALVLPDELHATLQVASYLNSFCFDFQARPRVSMHATAGLFSSAGFPRDSVTHPTAARTIRRVAALTFSDKELDAVFDSLWQDLRAHRSLGLQVEPPRPVSYDLWTRGLWRAEIDALVAHRMKLTAEAFAYVLSTFPLIDNPKGKKEPPLPGEDKSTITRDLALLALFLLHGRTPPADLGAFFTSIGLPRLTPTGERDLAKRVQAAYALGASPYLSDLLAKKRDATAPRAPRAGAAPLPWTVFAWKPDFEVMPPGDDFHRPGRTVPLEALRGVALAGASLAQDEDDGAGSDAAEEESVEQEAEAE